MCVFFFFFLGGGVKQKSTKEILPSRGNCLLQNVLISVEALKNCKHFLWWRLSRGQLILNGTDLNTHFWVIACLFVEQFDNNGLCCGITFSGNCLKMFWTIQALPKHLISD